MKPQLRNRVLISIFQEEKLVESIIVAPGVNFSTETRAEPLVQWSKTCSVEQKVIEQGTTEE